LTQLQPAIQTVYFSGPLCKSMSTLLQSCFNSLSFVYSAELRYSLYTLYGNATFITLISPFECQENCALSRKVYYQVIFICVCNSSYN